MKLDASMRNSLEVLFPNKLFYLAIGYVDMIQKDAVLAIRNGQMQLIEESMRLSIDRFGKLTTEENYQMEELKLDKNVSALKFEVKYVKVSAYNNKTEKEEGGDYEKKNFN
jgi:hypothetical protein